MESFTSPENDAFLQSHIQPLESGDDLPKYPFNTNDTGSPRKQVERLDQTGPRQDYLISRRCQHCGSPGHLPPSCPQSSTSLDASDLDPTSSILVSTNSFPVPYKQTRGIPSPGTQWSNPVWSDPSTPTSLYSQTSQIRRPSPPQGSPGNFNPPYGLPSRRSPIGAQYAQYPISVSVHHGHGYDGYYPPREQPWNPGYSQLSAQHEKHPGFFESSRSSPGRGDIIPPEPHIRWRSPQTTVPLTSVFQADGEVTSLRHDEAACSESTVNKPIAGNDAERPSHYIRESEYWLDHRKDPNNREVFTHGDLVPVNEVLARPTWISRSVIPLPTTSEKGTQTDDPSRPSSRGSFHGASLAATQDQRPCSPKETLQNPNHFPTQGSRPNGHHEKQEPIVPGSPKSMQVARKNCKRSRSEDVEESQDEPCQEEVEGPAKARRHKLDSSAYRYCPTIERVKIQDHAK